MKRYLLILGEDADTLRQTDDKDLVDLYLGVDYIIVVDTVTGHKLNEVGEPEDEIPELEEFEE